MQSSTTPKSEATAATATASTDKLGVKKGVRRLSHVIRQWRRGEEPPNARAEIQHRRECGEVSKDEFIDLVYEEFAALVDQGVDVDPAVYPQLFPTYKHSVRRVLEVHQWMATFDEADDTAWPEPGDRVQNYLVTAKLGEGGMARVYQARNLELGGRLEVIKLTRAISGEEAQIMGRLGHEHIVPVHNVSYDSGQTIIAMPYQGRATLAHIFEEFGGDVQGRTAAEILAAANDPLFESRRDARIEGTYVEGAVEIARQICAGLSHAHGDHVVHGDIKPSNVLLTPWGHALLLDFNLSSSAGDPSCIGGTIPYLAPEAARQLWRVVDAGAAPELTSEADDDASLPDATKASAAWMDLAEMRPTIKTDIFSLGVLLYELFTGQYPFGELDFDKVDALLLTLSERQRRPIKPVAEWNPDVDPTIAALVHRCLAVDPSDRPASMLEIEQALRQWQLERRWKEQEQRAVQEEKLRHAAEANASASAARASWRWAAVLVVAVMGSAAATSGLVRYWTTKPLVIQPDSAEIIQKIRQLYMINDLDEAIKLTSEAMDAPGSDAQLHAIYAFLMLQKGPRDHQDYREHYRIAYEAAKDKYRAKVKNGPKILDASAYNNYAWIIRKNDPELARDIAMDVLAHTDRYWQPHYTLASIALQEQLKEAPAVSAEEGANHLELAFENMPRPEVKPKYYLLAINLLMTAQQPERLSRLMDEAAANGLKYDVPVEMALRFNNLISTNLGKSIKHSLPSGSNLYKKYEVLIAPSPMRRSATETLSKPAPNDLADRNTWQE